MEALLFIFAEIIVACLAPVFAILGAAFAGLIELLAALLGGSFALWSERRKAKRRAAGLEIPDQPRKPLIPRKLVHWSAGVLGGLGLAGIAASFLFFQPILRLVIQSAGEASGIAVSYEGASGNLLFGRVALEGVALTRDSPGDDGLGFDLTVARVEADVDLWTLLGSEPRIELARAEGIAGSVSPPKPDKDKPKQRKERRPFRVDLAQVAAVEIQIEPKDSPAYMLEITRAEVAPFRSQLALFDLLFRSNMQASIAGQPLSVSTREITENGRETYWRFENVDAAQLKLLVPRAPLTWFDGGEISVRVDDRWSLSEDWIEMDWDVSSDDLAVSVPASAGKAEKLLGNGFAKIVQAKRGDARFQYRLRLNKEDIDRLRNGDLRQFWDVVLSGFLDRSPQAPDETPTAEPAADQGKIGKAVDGLKGLFKREKSEE